MIARLSMALAIVVSAAPVVAAERLRLRDAITTATQRNPQLAIATMRVVGAEAEIDRAAAAHDATLEIDAAGAATRRDPSQLPFVDDVSQDRVTGSVAIARRFERGTAVRVSASAIASRRRTRIPSAASATGEIATESVVPTVAAEWIEPLAGGRRAGGAERRSLDAARRAAALDHRVAVATTLRDVERAYWQLYLAERTRQIVAGSAALVEDQLRIVRAEIERGARPRLAATEIEDELARRSEDAMLAEAALAERSLDLARVLGVDPTVDLRTSDVPPDVAPGEGAGEATDDATAAAIARGDAVAEAMTAADDATRWRVDGFVRGSLTADTPALDDALVRAAGYGGWTVEAGVAVRIPLGDRARRAALAASRARLVEARTQIAEVEAAVASTIARERHRLRLAGRRRVALARSIELAEANLVAETRRWERGDGTTFDVLRRQSLLADARLRAERARVDELDARAGLDAATGRLLARHGVEVP